MAMNCIPGHNIYVGGIFSLRNKAALSRANITHVVSALRMPHPAADDILSSVQHLCIDVDDVEDENLIQHFPAAIRFIQSGLDSGGSVLVHCAMGKSRSAALCIAYLLHRQPKALTPQGALALIREGRPLCEPNEGFMQQLNLYHQMDCPDDVTGHPKYNRWLYHREVEDSVAIGRAPEMESVLFEDEQPHKPQEGSERSTEIKCRKCRRTLATTPFIIPHEQEARSNAKTIGTDCAHVFLHPLTWMRPSLFPETEDAPLSGRLTCPTATCGQNIGKFAWQGLQCSCGSWLVPAFGVAKARIDVVDRNQFAARSPAAALGIRLPPGMRDEAGKGNL